MEDSLKHIDELFRSQLGSAGVTPPPGVFEQCVQQLQTSAAEGQGLNQGATQQSVQSGLGNAVGSAGKTIFGLSVKASVAILGSVVAAVLVVTAIVKNNAPVSQVKDVNAGLPSTIEGSKNSDQTAAGINHDADKNAASSAKTNAEIGNSVLDVDVRRSLLDKSDDVASYGATITVLRKNNVGVKNAVGVKNSGGVKNASRIDNSLNASRAKSSNDVPVSKPTDNSNLNSRNIKVAAVTNSSPCNKSGNQWKSVISDITGGIVSLEIEGKYDKMRVDWADGERSELITDQVGVERVSHQYWVDRGRTFTIKLINERRILDDRGLGMICKDSQRIAVNIPSAGDATDIFVPDIFTPNGDGLNEEFYIGMAQPQMFDMCVFDLNKRLIFRSDKYDEKWKGICGSSLCPEGAYRVVISYKYSGDRSMKYARKTVKLIYNSNP